MSRERQILKGLEEGIGKDRGGVKAGSPEPGRVRRESRLKVPHHWVGLRRVRTETAIGFVETRNWRPWREEGGLEKVKEGICPGFHLVTDSQCTFPSLFYLTPVPPRLDTWKAHFPASCTSSGPRIVCFLPEMDWNGIWKSYRR